MSRPCDPKVCRHCRPERPCATTAMWLQEERRLEDEMGVIDANTERGRSERARMPARCAPTAPDFFGVHHETDPAKGDR